MEKYEKEVTTSLKSLLFEHVFQNVRNKIFCFRNTPFVQKVP